MSEILSIDKLREMANPIIDIPNFDNTGTIKVRVQRPKLLTMASQGMIPNHLMDIATTMVTGKAKTKKEKLDDKELIKQINSTMELYCMACLVEPKYEDFKDILTDDQKGTIFEWGIGEVSSLDTFRKNKADGTDNNNG